MRLQGGLNCRILAERRRPVSTRSRPTRFGLRAETFALSRALAGLWEPAGGELGPPEGEAANAGGSDAFVAKLDAAGTALVYSTYLGGSSSDVGYGIAVDAGGSAYLTGYTSSTNFPTAPAIPLQAANAGSDEAFVAKIGEPSTAVSLRSFAASRSGRLVVLRWRTGSDLGLLGFNLYRAQHGKLVKLNAALIPSVFAGTTSGHRYSFLDRSARRGVTYSYRLQAVSLGGTRAWLGTAVARR